MGGWENDERSGMECMACMWYATCGISDQFFLLHFSLVYLSSFVLVSILSSFLFLAPLHVFIIIKIAFLHVKATCNCYFGTRCTCYRVICFRNNDCDAAKMCGRYNLACLVTLIRYCLSYWCRFS
jgi:hypothetical protein